MKTQTEKTKSKLNNPTTITITINVTGEELKTFDTINQYHKSLSRHDIIISEVYKQFGCLSDTTLRTLSNWIKLDDKNGDQRNTTERLELAFSPMRCQLFECVAKIINRKVEWIVEKAFRDAVEMLNSYHDELIDLKSSKYDKETALDVIQDVGKDTLIYLSEDKARSLQKDSNGLTTCVKNVTWSDNSSNKEEN